MISTCDDCGHDIEPVNPLGFDMEFMHVNPAHDTHVPAVPVLI